MQLLHVVRFKWNSSEKHCIQTNSKTPAINTIPCVSLSSDDFRCNISWGPALFIHNFIALELFRHSEISNFDKTILIQK